MDDETFDRLHEAFHAREAAYMDRCDALRARCQALIDEAEKHIARHVSPIHAGGITINYLPILLDARLAMDREREALQREGQALQFEHEVFFDDDGDDDDDPD